MEAEGGHLGLNGDNKGLFVGKWRQYGSYWRLHEGLRADRVCLGYCKPDKGYWAAKTGQVAAVLGLVRAVLRLIEALEEPMEAAWGC